MLIFFKIKVRVKKYFSSYASDLNKGAFLIIRCTFNTKILNTFYIIKHLDCYVNTDVSICCNFYQFMVKT